MLMELIWLGGWYDGFGVMVWYIYILIIVYGDVYIKIVGNVEWIFFVVILNFLCGWSVNIMNDFYLLRFLFWWVVLIVYI